MKTNPPSKTLHKMTFSHITFNICSQLPLPSAEADTQAALTFWLGGETVAVIVLLSVGYPKRVMPVFKPLIFHFEFGALEHYLFRDEMNCQHILADCMHF